MTDADKLVEEMRRAYFEREHSGPNARMRAALAVAVERCAVAVEDAGGDNAEYHAEKVRSLSPNAKEETK